MDTETGNFNPFENFIGKDVSIILDKRLLSSTASFGGVIYITGKIIKVYSRFILIQNNKKKEILINIDNIVGIE